MISEEDKWLFFYTLPCHRGSETAFQRRLESGNFAPVLALDGDYRREAVRSYFLGEHNLKAIDRGNIPCILMQYQIISINPHIRGRICNGSYKLPECLQEIVLAQGDLERAVRFGVLDQGKKLKPGDFVFMHGGLIVDVEFDDK